MRLAQLFRAGEDLLGASEVARSLGKTDSMLVQIGDLGDSI